MTSFGTAFIMSVSVMPGATAFTRMPFGPSSLARDFVKPFTFSGDSVNATIQDKIPGKISKQGNFWVVEELLEISIN